MEPRKYVAYYRVSTDRQGQSGLGLEAQKAAVAAHIRADNGALIAEHVEVETGRRADRPELSKALNACRRDRAVLIIAKLDRLARNVHFVSGLMESGVEFRACDFPEANRLTIHILAAVAEHEASAIADRTSSALQAAKARGKPLGWAIPDRQQEQRIAAIHGAAVGRQKADDFAFEVRPIIEQIRAAGIQSLQGIANALNARGIRTARGGRWHPTTVSNVIRRIGGTSL